MGIRANILKKQQLRTDSHNERLLTERIVTAEPKCLGQLATVHQIGSRANRDCYEALDVQEAASRRDIIGELCERIISEVMNVPLSGLRSKSRNIAEIAFARQMAMYLMSTKAGYLRTEVSIYFRRHISTVSHACELVEDRRDDCEFDAMLIAIEDILEEIDDVHEFLLRIRAKQDGHSSCSRTNSGACLENAQ